MGSGKNCMKEFFFKLLSIIRPTRYWIGPLPSNYLDLKLEKKLNHNRSYFGTGMYTDKKGKKFIVKFWSGNHPDACYYLLQREIKFLSDINKISKNSKEVLFPVFVRSDITHHGLTLVTQHFKGHPNGSYIKAHNFLQRLPVNLSIPSKSRWYFIILFPIIWVISALRHWYHLPLFIQSFFTFWANSPSLINRDKAVFVHGDLHPDNLLTDGKRIMILDVGQSMYTYPEFEIASTLACYTIDSKLRNKLLSFSNTPVFKTIGIFCAAYNLTRPTSSVHTQVLFDLLKVCLKPY